MENSWNCNESYEEHKKTLKPWQGILMFLLVMLSFYSIIAWMQGKWGMYGLALTELYLLLLSVAGAKLLKQPLRAIFPVKKPEWKKLAAVLLYWISSYALVIPLTMLVAYFFPEQMFSVSEHMNTFMASVSPLLAVLITSVMPAVCEEAMHRGFILKCFQSRIKNIWILTILMGVLFGLFHGSIWRFLPTALLGGVLSYLMIRTENMIYPAFFHFINNFLPSFLANLAVGISGNAQADAAGQQLMEQGLPLSFLGIYFAMACIVPFGFYTADYLLRKGEPGREQHRYLSSNKMLVVLVILTILPMILGMVLFLYGLFFDSATLFNNIF